MPLMPSGLECSSLLQQHFFQGGSALRRAHLRSPVPFPNANSSSCCFFRIQHEPNCFLYHPSHLAHFFQEGLALQRIENKSLALLANPRRLCFYGVQNEHSCFQFRHPCRHEVRCAATKQKKKRLGGKKASRGGKGPDFEEMMLLWDDIFGKVCEDSDKVETLKSIAQDGLQAYGRGCVLLSVAGRILPRGAGRGFLSSSRTSSSRSDDPPPYSILQWTASYVPREFIIDPMKAADDAAKVPFGSNTPSTEMVLDETGAKPVPLIGQRMLLRVLKGGLDRTRLLSLTGKERETASGNSERTVELGFDIEAAGGEKPYEPNEEEMVLMLAVDFDGTPVVGADVVQALLDTRVTENAGDHWSWKLQLRDSENFPL